MLARMTNDELMALISRSEAATGWGSSRTLTIGNHQVFCKCIPLTDAQAEDPTSTANLHRLPTFYNYGVGSAGFSPGREVEMHHKTTTWVLDGDTPHFPLLYHDRVLPLAGEGRTIEGKSLDRYVRSWDDDERIRAYIEARNASTQSMVTFVEWVPHTLQTWLNDHQHRIDDVIDQLGRAIGLLQANDIVHFDTNLSNIVTDGATMFLTDFGLALDAAFDLDATERDFLAAHRHFDHGEFLSCLDLPLQEVANTWDKATRNSMVERLGGHDTKTLLANLETLLADGTITLDPAYVQVLLRHRATITAMSKVFERIFVGPRGQPVYDDDALRSQMTADLEPDAGDP